MKPSNLIPLFAVFTASVLFSCKRPDENKIDLNEGHMASIKGNYEWIGSQNHTTSQGIPSSAYMVPTDSTDRYGITVEESGTLTYFKNGSMEQSGYITGTSAGSDGAILASCTLAGLNALSFTGINLFCNHYPMSMSESGSNYYKKSGSTPYQGTFTHVVPDCSGSYGDIGSYTGYELVMVVQPPFTDTASYEQKTFYIVPGNPLACKVSIQSASGAYVAQLGYSSNSYGGSSYGVSNNYLNMSRHIVVNMGGQFTVYSFHGLKD